MLRSTGHVNKILTQTKTQVISEDLGLPIIGSIDVFPNGSLTVSFAINFNRHRPVDLRNCAPHVAGSEFSPRAIAVVCTLEGSSKCLLSDVGVDATRVNTKRTASSCLSLFPFPHSISSPTARRPTCFCTTLGSKDLTEAKCPSLELRLDLHATTPEVTKPGSISGTSSIDRSTAPHPRPQ